MSIIRNKRLRQLVFERDAGICAVCRVYDAKWEADHIVDLQFGGRDTLDNAQTLCRRHHQAKTSAAAPVRAKADRLAERHQQTLRRRRVGSI